MKKSMLAVIIGAAGVLAATAAISAAAIMANNNKNSDTKEAPVSAAKAFPISVFLSVTLIWLISYFLQTARMIAPPIAPVPIHPIFILLTGSEGITQRERVYLELLLERGYNALRENSSYSDLMNEISNIIDLPY